MVYEVVTVTVEAGAEYKDDKPTPSVQSSVIPKRIAYCIAYNGGFAVGSPSG